MYHNSGGAEGEVSPDEVFATRTNKRYTSGAQCKREHRFDPKMQKKKIYRRLEEAQKAKSRKAQTDQSEIIFVIKKMTVHSQYDDYWHLALFLTAHSYAGKVFLEITLFMQFSQSF